MRNKVLYVYEGLSARAARNVDRPPVVTKAGGLPSKELLLGRGGALEGGDLRVNLLLEGRLRLAGVTPWLAVWGA